MTLAAGQRIGVYEITGSLGAGGMGEVYRARDTRLGRDVALKVLPLAFAADVDRLARFEREAQVLAALNHPNIAHIYGVEEAVPGGSEAGTATRALVMELVEGETLMERLARGPLAVTEVRALLPQLIDALDAAHEVGVVHRDLKPGNIAVREDGTLKVLDFGLAKALTPGDSHDEATGLANSPTITTPAMTRAGLILGTAAYMSPEQARGKRVDKRADIWAFGCVLFEMLTGRKPFDGETVTDTLAAIVTREPEWSALPSATPPSLRRLLMRCLVKDPRQRLRDIGDAREELARITASDTPEPHATSSTSRWRGAVPWAVAAVAMALAAIAWNRVPPTSAPTAGSARFTVQLPDETAVVADTPGSVRAAGSFVVSPDGRHLVIVANGPGGRLWVRPIDSLETRLLQGTEGAIQPFWSPDGRRIGFFTPTHLKTVDIETSLIQVLSDMGAGNGGTWNAEGTILFSNSQRRLYRIPATGGSPVQVTELDTTRGDTGHRWPVFLPDGRKFLVFVGRRDASNRGVFIGALDSPTLSAVVLADSNAAYADGRLLYLRGNTLFAQPFDPDRGTVSGEPAILVQGVLLNTTSRRGEFSVSRSGILTYTTADLAVTQLGWFDRSGLRLGSLEAVAHQAIAPDDVRVAADRVDSAGANRDIWVFDSKADTRTRLTFTVGDDWVPEWSPDGTRIAYTSARDTPGAAQLYVKDASGSGAETLLLRTEKDKHHLSWSPDGRFLAYEEAGEGDGRDIWVLPLADPGNPRPVLQGRFNEAQPAFAPDSRYLGYTSNETGRLEVYVQTFPPTGGRWQVSQEGGIQPRWRRDGKEMYYLASDGRIMALDVDLSVPRFGVPKPLFQTGQGGDSATEHFAVTSDGRRFLVIDRESGQIDFTVVLNWPSLLDATARSAGQ